MSRQERRRRRRKKEKNENDYAAFLAYGTLITIEFLWPTALQPEENNFII